MGLSPSDRRGRRLTLLAIGLGGLVLSSCDTRDMGQGYALRFGDRGQTWIQNPDRSIADDASVLSVWSDDEVIVYQVRGEDHPGCDYRMIRKGAAVFSPISPEQAMEAVTTRAAKLHTSSSNSCPLGSARR